MSDSIKRRSFIKGGTALGVSSILGGSVAGWMKPAFAEAPVDIAAVKGANYFQFDYSHPLSPLEKGG